MFKKSSHRMIYTNQEGDFLNIRNLVFEGAGTSGIAYLGVLDYLYHNGWMKEVYRIGGTSSGAITACIGSLNLPFEKIKSIASSLDYKSIPSKSEFDDLMFLSEDVKEILDELFGDINCIYRLVNQYGWYSTDYFYDWIKEVIAEQFDSSKKKPPYTFSDFKNPKLHKENRPFLNLYIVGTNLSMKTSEVYSFETTPEMEVAQAVRISMSIPLFFEAVKTEETDAAGNSITNVLCDGGAMNNYPLNLFDSPKYNSNLYYGINMETLGVRFESRLTYEKIDNLIQYIGGLLNLYSYIQQENFENNPLNKMRSIQIDSDEVNPMDFNIETGDFTYKLLYNRGYQAAEAFFHI